jgi:hypothetical protein
VGVYGYTVTRKLSVSLLRFRAPLQRGRPQADGFETHRTSLGAMLPRFTLASSLINQTCWAFCGASRYLLEGILVDFLHQSWALLRGAGTENFTLPPSRASPMTLMAPAASSAFHLRIHLWGGMIFLGDFDPPRSGYAPRPCSARECTRILRRGRGRCCRHRHFPYHGYPAGGGEVIKLVANDEAYRTTCPRNTPECPRSKFRLRLRVGHHGRV